MKNVRIKLSTDPSIFRRNFYCTATGFLKYTAGIILLMALFILPSCEKDDLDQIQNPDSIIPERFIVEIPNSISSSNNLKSTGVDTLQGNNIYQHLRTFISVGEYGAELVQNVMLSIAVHNLNRPMDLTFISDDDGRPKHVKINEDAYFEGTHWQYRLTLTDIQGQDEGSEKNIGLQVFWNLHPLKGIAIMNPYNISRKTEKDFLDTDIRIDYSEAGELGYEAHMIVSIAGFPLPDPLEDPYALSKLKMFVGKSADLVALYGNSEHPNANFFSSTTGFDWAFVAAGSESQDIAVAEVGLPPMDLDASDRETILETYSIRNVLHNQILSVWPNINQDILDAYLYHTEAPGYFDRQGFVQAGTAPSQAWLPLREYIRTLIPYNPATISGLSIEFDE
ncbi:MAG: hypothetical protein R6U58_01945 [Bacteroidales bacterium]